MGAMAAVLENYLDLFAHNKYSIRAIYHVMYWYYDLELR